MHVQALCSSSAVAMAAARGSLQAAAEASFTFERHCNPSSELCTVHAGTVLFQLPVTLRVTTAAAREGLQAAAEAAASSTSAASREALEEEDDVAVLGLWLARERAKVRCAV